MLDEQTTVLTNLGSSEEATLLRAKMQSRSLLSDMESFKVRLFITLQYLTLSFRQQIQQVLSKILYDGIPHVIGLKSKKLILMEIFKNIMHLAHVCNYRIIYGWKYGNKHDQYLFENRRDYSMMAKKQKRFD